MNLKNNFSETTTERYALALYELARENSELDKIEKESKDIKELINQSLEFRSLLKDPTNKKKIQIETIKMISEKLKFTQIFTKFLCFLSSKRRLFFLDKIINNFLKITSRNRGEIKARLSSSKELSPNELESIQKELSENFTSKIMLDYSYDPTLIGGLVIQVGSIMIDTSIKNKLRILETKMVQV